MKLNVLVLHNLENFQQSRRSALDYVLCWQRYAPENNYLYHRITFPATLMLREVPWDLIIFGSTSLGICTFRPRELFAREKEKWSFLSKSEALKLVFPQDDANHGALLDEWFAQLGVDVLYTVRPEFSELLYPETSRRAEVLETMAGLVDDDSIEYLRNLRKPFKERSIEIGQRVTMYPPRGGRHAMVKGVSAEVVKAAASTRGIKVDISTDPKDVLSGDDWYRFLGNCRFILGAEGGLGIWDPRGEISDRIEAYTSAHPDAKFEEIEAACFPGLDGKHVFPGISPRVFEATLMGCGLILVEGEYRGLIKPYEHYIPLRRDYSNIDEVFEMMRDEEGTGRRIQATYSALIEDDRFRHRNFVSRVMSRVRHRLGRRTAHHELSHSSFRALSMCHRSELLDEVIRETGLHGFQAEAQVARILFLLGDQCAELLVHPSRRTAQRVLKYRAELIKEARRRIASHFLQQGLRVTLLKAIARSFNWRAREFFLSKRAANRSPRFLSPR